MLLSRKGGSATMVYSHALNIGPSECVARRPLPKAEADGSQIRNLGPLRGTLYI